MQDQKLPPIDEELTTCIHNTDTISSPVEATDQQLRCLSEAYSKWDAELNRKYNDLDQLLDVRGKQVLQEAQLEWIRYRDAEFELIKVVYPPQALINRVLAASKKQEIVKTRVIELNQYLGFLH
jgi:uncharacterized protein YecT (DUF1311 family)